jgi:hypothetical protein
MPSRVPWKRMLLLTAVAAWLAAHAWLWSVLPPVPRHTFPAEASASTPASPITLAFTPDSRSVVVLGAAHIRVWDVESGRLDREWPWPAAAPDGRTYFPTYTISPEGRRMLLIISAPVAPAAGHFGLALFDLGTGRVTALPPLGLGPYAGWWRQLDFMYFYPYILSGFSPDGRLIAMPVGLTEPGSFAVRMWDIDAQAGREVPIDGPGHPPVFAPDGRTLAVWVDGLPSAESHVLLIDSATGDRLGRLVTPAGEYVWLSFAPDGRTLTVCGRDSSSARRSTDPEDYWMQVWDVPTRQRHATLRDARNVGWDADGRLIVLGSAGLHVHDPRAGTRLAAWDVSEQHRHNTLLCEKFVGRGIVFLISIHDPPAWQTWIAERLTLPDRLVPRHRIAVHLLDTHTGRDRAFVWAGPANHGLPMVSPDGRTIAGFDHTGWGVCLWDVPPMTPGGIVLLLMITEVGVLTAWTAWRRRRVVRHPA